jgi:hypothetical protein
MNKWRRLRVPLIMAVMLVAALGTFYWLGYAAITGSEPKWLASVDPQAELSFNIPDNIQVNEPFQVVVRVDTQQQKVNAAGVNLHFNPSMLQLLSHDTRSSFCQFYPEKKHDNRTGTITLACGSPHPGFTGSNTLMTLEFLPIKVGVSTLSTNINSQILASDGKGTNILTSFPQIDLKVGNTP